MQYRKLGNTGVRVSELCQSTMTFGNPTDEAHSIRIVQHALDADIDFIDCANTYGGKGGAETIVGAALAGKRDTVVLATKLREVMGARPADSGASRAASTPARATRIRSIPCAAGSWVSTARSLTRHGRTWPRIGRKFC